MRNARFDDYSARVKLTRRKIAVYAGTPCEICGEVLDPRVTWWTDPSDGKRKRHPMSLELDEIVPLSKGGSPTSWDNTRIVHRRCNLAKGNEDDDRARARLGISKIEKSETRELETSQNWFEF